MFRIIALFVKISFLIILFFFSSCIHYIGRNKSRDNHSSIYRNKDSSLNKIIRDLSFFPINGLRFRLSELKDKKAIVIFMRERDCPISEKYGPRIAGLERQYSKKGVQFIYNYVGRVRKNESAKQDLKRFDFKGPYVIDSKQAVVMALNAKTTGDVFILTPQREIIYKGPVDDQYHILKSALRPKNHYVSDILKSVTSNIKIKPKEIPAPGCIIDRPVIKKKIFWSDIASIVQKKCTICHNPSGSGPINYINYKDVAGRKAMFKYVIENDLMPPWFIDPNTGPWEEDLSLTPMEKILLLKWVDNGGLKKPGTPKPLWTEEKKPKLSADYTIFLPETVVIPAEGPPTSIYKKFLVVNSFTEDKWIKSIRLLLNSKAIHHVNLMIVDSLFDNSDLEKNFFDIASKASTVISAGNFGNVNLHKMPNKETGIKLPANSRIILVIHYEPIGTKFIDNFTRIQLNFYKKKPKYKVITYTLSNIKLNIPPYESTYKAKMSYEIKKTMSLISVGLHMHLRGKAGSVFIINPKTGMRKKVFSLDPFIENYQKNSLYQLKKPIVVSKGSIVECINWFDNSRRNLINPAPEKYVVYGPSSEKNEMSMCFLSWIISSDINTTTPPWIENI